MKIVDAHHHFWDTRTNPHPWLCEVPPIAFRYGDYRPICRPYLPEDYDRDADGWEVIATVTMEGEWAATDPTGETDWIWSLHQRTGRPAAHAAQAWLDAPDVGDVLAHGAACPIVRSVRHKPRSNAAPGGPPGGMMDAAFQAGFRLLARHDLMFELQTPWWHLGEAVTLAALADVPIVLNHTGLPADRSDGGLAAWHQAMEQLAAVDQVIVKISGLGLTHGGWDPAGNRDIIRRTVDLFGPHRCMFASNFPVDSLCAGYDTLWRSFDAATSDYTPDERAALFHRTALSTYRITETP